MIILVRLSDRFAKDIMLLLAEFARDSINYLFVLIFKSLYIINFGKNV